MAESLVKTVSFLHPLRVAANAIEQRVQGLLVQVFASTFHHFQHRLASGLTSL